MSPPNKILGHPSKNQIIQWLTTGVSVRDVEHRLAQMYPDFDQEELRVSASSIQNFRKEHLNLDEKVLADVKHATSASRKAAESAVIQAQLENVTAYQDAITGIASDQLEMQREIVKVFTLLSKRIEKLYDVVNMTNVVDAKTERVLLGYFEQIQNNLDRYAKYVNGHSEKQELNVSINVAVSQIDVIREAVREVLADLDPSAAVVFMGKLAGRMKTLEFHHVDYDGVVQGSNVTGSIKDGA